ncbi:porin [Cupriavidus basilensis]|uniref:porin n=1 Tax=Cupriavidus basilensis TaxID=68895 RepID=UPI0009E33BCC|nr:porin [Cupriavidus basilensis]
MKQPQACKHLRNAILTGGTALIAGSAQAQSQSQSNLILYGVMDAGIEYLSHFSDKVPTAANGYATGAGHNTVRMSSGNLAGSRFGMRGEEDLGGGLKALFVLESGFTADDGRLAFNGRLFGRQALVGLGGHGAWRVTFGRQSTSIYDGFANFAPAAYTKYEPAGALGGYSSRSDNMAKFAAQVGPLIALAHWSFGNGIFSSGEVPGQFRRDTGYGTALNYALGRYGVAVAYDQYNPTLTAAGDSGTFRRAGVAGNYVNGALTLQGGVRWGLDKNGAGATLMRDNMYWIGANYLATPALNLTLAYYYDDIKLANASLNRLPATNAKNPWQVLFIADYSLSRRTNVYVLGAYAKHAGIGLDTAAGGFVNGYYLASGKDSMFAATLGIRTKF